MRNLFFAIALLFPSSGIACEVDAGWGERKMQEADRDQDGKISYSEYKLAHTWTADEEHIARNNWDALPSTKGYLTSEEFLSSQRPKCGGGK